jgi:ubiquitin-protein ligase
MSGRIRLLKEFNEIQGSKPVILGDIDVSDSNSLFWKLKILPQSDPYRAGVFKIELNFPGISHLIIFFAAFNTSTRPFQVEYPFRPPVLRFITPIYHPNVDDKGNVCLTLINTDNWKPATKILPIVKALVKLIDEPDLVKGLQSN